MALRTFSRNFRTLSVPRPRHTLQPRLLSTTLSIRATDSGDHQKEAQKDREKMNTDANETSKSGTDDTAAQNEEAAFDPNITSPEGAKDKAGEGKEGNPLEMSPANQEVSQGTSENDGGAKKKGSV